MNWFVQFLTSSVGRKFFMGLTGLFLISFLLVHMAGNLQLLYSDEGRHFNEYAHFMTSNTIVKTISYSLYTFILLHAFLGWYLWRKNSAARGSKGYAVKKTRSEQTSAFASSNMGWLGTIIFVFLLIHLYQFWLQMKLGNTPMVTYDGEEVKNLYVIVAEAYQNPGYVVFYVVSMIVVYYHLLHGFQSAFQTLGLNHRKYTPVIKFLGKAYSLVVSLGFAIIPVYMYFFNK